MSAIDDLRKFESEWRNHEEWASGRAYTNVETGEAHRDSKGKYVHRLTAYDDIKIDLSQVPKRMRVKAIEALESAIRQSIYAAHSEEWKRLRKAALDEAQLTVAEITKTGGAAGSGAS